MLSTLVKVVTLCSMLLVSVMVFNAAFPPQTPALPVAPRVIPHDALNGTRLASHLSHMVTFDTTTRFVGDVPARPILDKMHAYLAAAFPRTHAALEREEVEESGSVLYVWRGSDASLAPYLLAAHLDVVPADSVDDWEVPPFSGAVSQDGYVYGRGTLDNKVNVLGQLEAVEELLGRGFAPKRTLYLAYGADEEVMGTRGAAVLAKLVKADMEKHYPGADKLFFVSDEGLAIAHDMVPGIPVAGLIGIAEKGYTNVKLEVAMTGGHASMPHPGENAVGVLAKAVVALDSNPFPAALGSVTRAMLASLCPEMPFHLRLVMCNLWATDWLVSSILLAKPATAAQLRTTTSVNILKGGSKANVVADTASAVLNHRIVSTESVSSVLQHDKDLVNDDRVKISIEGPPTEPSPVSDPESTQFGLIASALRSIFPDAIPAPGLLMACTDTKYYLELSDHVFRFMPIRVTSSDLPRIHGVNERISVENFVDVVAYYAQLISQVDQISPP